MPKQKTKKAAKKRFAFSAAGKVKRLRVGQSHFNARANGAATRKKHNDQHVDSTDQGRIVRLLPYK